MRLEHYPENKIKKEIVAIVSKYLDISQYKIFIFGSRVTGKGNDRSDIDVGIEGETEIPSNIISKIKEDLDNIRTLYKIDFVDFKKVAPDFREVALQNIEPIL